MCQNISIIKDVSSTRHRNIWPCVAKKAPHMVEWDKSPGRKKLKLIVIFNIVFDIHVNCCDIRFYFVLVKKVSWIIKTKNLN